MTHRYITLREVGQATLGTGNDACRSRPRGTGLAAGPAPAARPPAPGWGTLRHRAWTAAHRQYCPLHWRAAAAAHRRRPRRDDPSASGYQLPSS
jgi:hypothetical protein